MVAPLLGLPLTRLVGNMAVTVNPLSFDSKRNLHTILDCLRLLEQEHVGTDFSSKCVACGKTNRVHAKGCYVEKMIAMASRLLYDDKNKG